MEPNIPPNYISNITGAIIWSALKNADNVEY